VKPWPIDSIFLGSSLVAEAMVVLRPRPPGGAEGSYPEMEQWTRIRLELRDGEKNERELMRREGMHGETPQKIRDHSEPPGYRMTVASMPK